MRAAVLVLLLGLTACSAGESCDALPGLTQERDAARAAWTAAVRDGAPEDEVLERHDAMHALDTRVFGLQESCA